MYVVFLAKIIKSQVPRSTLNSFKPPRQLGIYTSILEQSRGMKRRAESSPGLHANKSVKVEDYCSVKPVQSGTGDPIWPAPESQIDAARTFFKEW